MLYDIYIDAKIVETWVETDSEQEAITYARELSEWSDDVEIKVVCVGD